ncbi:hypothetical protein TUMSATVNIG3_26270 [Vibrio nigripulchritudo]|nr:hypothetical protein TUMSATVNIG2_25750 [Vibrio nigripulchritudo]BDU43829.1 hypothetical protein TUMSATVNIG3_26270 [Vibrio nigripulchritudo]
MLGAALTPLLWTVIAWAYIGYAMFQNEPIPKADWLIVGTYTICSLVYVAIRAYGVKNQ